MLKLANYLLAFALLFAGVKSVLTNAAAARLSSQPSGQATRSTTPTASEFEASLKQAQLSSQGALVLDAALVLLDRSSTSEVLVVGGHVALIPGEEFSLQLTFDSDASATRDAGSMASGLQATAYSDSFSLPANMGAARASLRLQGTLFGASQTGVQLLEFELHGTQSFQSRSRSTEMALGNFAMPLGSVVTALGHGDSLLLVSVGKPDSLGQRSSDLDRWISRARWALELPPVEQADVNAAVKALTLTERKASRFHWLAPVDPALEFVQLGAALADRALLDEARGALAGDAQSHLDALRPWHWGEYLGKRPAVRTRDYGLPERTASVILSGAIPLTRAVDLSERHITIPPFRTAPYQDTWEGQLFRGFDPVRTAASTIDADIGKGVHDLARLKSKDPHARQHLAAALGENLGSDDVGRASWSRLAKNWIDSASNQVRLTHRGGIPLVKWSLVPWLLALIWISIPHSKRLPGPLSILGVAAALIASFLLFLGIPAAAIPVAVIWGHTGAVRLASGKRAVGEKVSLLMALGCSFSLLGNGLDLTPVHPQLEPLFRSTMLFSFLFLTFVFASEPKRWSRRSWMALLVPTLALTLFDFDGAAASWLRLATLIIGAIFLRSSWRMRDGSTVPGIKPPRQ